MRSVNRGRKPLDPSDQMHSPMHLMIAVPTSGSSVPEIEWAQAGMRGVEISPELVFRNCLQSLEEKLAFIVCGTRASAVSDSYTKEKPGLPRN